MEDKEQLKSELDYVVKMIDGFEKLQDFCSKLRFDHPPTTLENIDRVERLGARLSSLYKLRHHLEFEIDRHQTYEQIHEITDKIAHNVYTKIIDIEKDTEENEDIVKIANEIKPLKKRIF